MQMISRRNFMAVAGAAAVASILTACGRFFLQHCFFRSFLQRCCQL